MRPLRARPCRISHITHSALPALLLVITQSIFTAFWTVAATNNWELILCLQTFINEKFLWLASIRRNSLVWKTIAAKQPDYWTVDFHLGFPSNISRIYITGWRHTTDCSGTPLGSVCIQTIENGTTETSREAYRFNDVALKSDNAVVSHTRAYLCVCWLCSVGTRGAELCQTVSSGKREGVWQSINITGVGSLWQDFLLTRVPFGGILRFYPELCYSGKVNPEESLLWSGF